MKGFNKIVLIIICLFISFSFINAEENNTLVSSNPTSYNDGSARANMDNYGVSKKWNITDNNKSNVLRTPKVDASLKVYDYANILSDEDEKQIKTYIDSFIEHTNMDMVFVTINMPYTNDHDNEDYAADFYDYNDFGLDFDKYSGVLLLRNNYELDRYFNVYTFGEAQLYFDYNRCENMLDDIYNDFKSDNYVVGFQTFVNDFTRYYDSGKALSDYYVDDMGYIHKDRGAFKIPYLICALAGGAVALIALLIMVKKNKMVKKASLANDYIDKSKVVFNRKTDDFLTTVTTRHRLSNDSGGGGFSSSSGSSGGGHGGGGGRHG